jgi:hypothetical protein
MRIISTIFACGMILIVPAMAATSEIKKQFPGDDQPRGERYQDRWQGRQHILYDEVEGSDGRAVDRNAECRSISVRYRRPDGTTGIRRENTCD